MLSKLGSVMLLDCMTEKDIETYLSNPEIVNASMDFYDRMEALGYTPEEASAMMANLQKNSVNRNYFLFK